MANQIKEIPLRKQWFLDRIGKTVYRSKTTCDCDSCNTVVDVGLIIVDNFHATYLYDVEGSYQFDGFPLKYFDTKEEAIAFEKENPIPEKFLKHE